MYEGCNLVKVFSVSRARERSSLGDTVTEWLGRNNVEVLNTVVVQSSDDAFHCLTIVLFCRG